ncbi:galactonate dehydratase, putative [Talaromyces stipitatus ATCC 10500]|uniref:Galactonate dehydratase, putative n=1 Tax=Talaromyces stipitatus (strain ATCC 10500 / CBS 375.48 / QM 6759 / NRRL 1006) TaxID=441959 RepID=B8MME7_TALSN|nr:galactonate dehydratase, putative [Talaromyces stipitatus ATCC 10500]EED13701.1 galactonate dehydratase, putative [Talaromyces stipitatus ATCC 10500]
MNPYPTVKLLNCIATMIVTKIEIFDCEVSLVGFNPVMVRVHTDEGISGLGEVGLAYGAGAKAAVGILRDLARFVLGKDPMNVEAIWEEMYRRTYWGMGGGPVIYGGISAYDIALWDIRGKVLKAPIYQLLGGKTNDKLRTYASQIQFGWGGTPLLAVHPSQYAEGARLAIAEGYDAIKVDPLQVGRDGSVTPDTGVKRQYFGLLRHDEIQMGVERIAAIREAVGPNVDIICEIHANLGTNAAIQFAMALEPYNIMFYEEPVNPLNANNFARIAEKTTIPLATGERSYTRWGYRELLEKQALAVVQPDLCLVGGITEGKKICDLANLYDATVQVHVCGGPVSTAASLHLEAVIPNFIIHEHHTYALKPCIRELCVNDYQPQQGQFTIPNAPGLGQELNEVKAMQYLVCTIESNEKKERSETAQPTQGEYNY